MRFDELTRRLGFHAALLFAIGALTGLLLAGAATGVLPAETDAVLAAHLNAILGTFLLLGLAFTSRHWCLSERGQRALVFAFLLSSYANWAVTLTKAFLHVRGLEISGNVTNDAIAGLLTVLVALPTLVGAALWTFAMRKPIAAVAAT